MDKKVEPRGIRNNNPMNIRKGNNWKGEKHPQTDAAFEQFESMQYGVRAGLKILKNYMTGYNGLAQKANTIEKMITRWAPPSENNTRSYISTFSERSFMVAIVDARIRVECGQSIDKSIIESAYDMV